MMRSMYSGVAGLKTHQTKMDVIGNNIANVNTVAYKSQSVTFSELMYQTTQAASGANALTGTAGVNARQIGLGVKTGAINTNITAQGASQTTNNPFDIRITGNAFFIVSDGKNNFFTRDGSFYVDGIGNLAMTSNGYNVMGWGLNDTKSDIKQDTVSKLRIMDPDNLTYPPEATTKAYVTGIIDKNDSNVTSASGKTVNLFFYDKLGYSYTAKMNMKDTAEDGVYTLSIDSILDSNNDKININGLNFGSTVDIKEEVGLTLQKDAGYSWDEDGKVLSLNGTVKYTVTDNELGDTDTAWAILADAYGYDSTNATKLQEFKDLKINTVSVGNILNDSTTGTAGKRTVAGVTDLVNVTASKAATRDNAFKITYNASTGKFEGIDDNTAATSINLNLSNINGTDRFENITVDLSTTTMFNNSRSSTITATNGDVNKLGSGRKIGKMSGISIQDDGRIYASYDNGQSRLLGQIAVAEFANASGLEKEGDNLYKASQNSGDFDGTGVNVKANGGYLTTGVLEMSNVDLSAEFTEMITTQRGFQANSRIITVSDTLLEELVNLKR